MENEFQPISIELAMIFCGNKLPLPAVLFVQDPELSFILPGNNGKQRKIVLPDVCNGSHPQIVEAAVSAVVVVG